MSSPLSLVQGSPAGRVSGVELSPGLQEMPHHLQPLLLPLGLPDQSVSGSVDSQVERRLALTGGLVQLGQGGERADQLQAA